MSPKWAKCSKSTNDLFVDRLSSGRWRYLNCGDGDAHDHEETPDDSAADGCVAENGRHARNGNLGHGFAALELGQRSGCRTQIQQFDDILQFGARSVGGRGSGVGAHFAGIGNVVHGGVFGLQSTRNNQHVAGLRDCLVDGIRRNATDATRGR